MNNSKNQLSFNIRVEVFKDEKQTTPLLTVEDKTIQIDSEEMELIFIKKPLNLQPGTYYLIVEVKCQDHQNLYQHSVTQNKFINRTITR